MTLSSLLDWIIIIYGIVMLVGIIFRPSFFWNSRRMRQRRALIGDRNTILMYFIIGLVMLGLGGAGFWGYL